MHCPPSGHGNANNGMADPAALSLTDQCSRGLPTLRSWTTLHMGLQLGDGHRIGARTMSGERQLLRKAAPSSPHRAAREGGREWAPPRPPCNWQSFGRMCATFLQSPQAQSQAARCRSGGWAHRWPQPTPHLWEQSCHFARRGWIGGSPGSGVSRPDEPVECGRAPAPQGITDCCLERSLRIILGMSVKISDPAAPERGGQPSLPSVPSPGPQQDNACQPIPAA